VYSSMYAKNDDEIDQEGRDENLTEGHNTFQQKKAVGGTVRKVAGSSVRPRGGALGGSLQDNMTGEFGGGAARSARKVAQRVVNQPAEPVPMMTLEGGAAGGTGMGARTSMIILQDRRDFVSTDGRAAGIRRLIEFLAVRGYDKQISEKDLSSPTVAMFRDILISIASLVDPYATEDIASKVKAAKGQWETAVCQFFRNVRYPFNLSPKQINAVGSANAWPKFLGALVWLVELIDMGEAKVEDILLMSNVERRNQMSFLQSAYAAYMQGEDAAFERVLLQLRANAETQSLELKRTVTDASSRVRDLEQQFAKLNGLSNSAADTTGDNTTSMTAGNSVEVLRRDVENLRKDVVTLTTVVETWRKKRESSKSKCIAGEKDLEDMMRDLAEAEHRKAEEQKRLERQLQVLKNSDLSRINSERIRYEKSLEELFRDKEEVDGQVWSIKQEIDQAKTLFQRRLMDLNSRCARLGGSSYQDLDAASIFERGGLAQFERCQTFLTQLQDKFLAQGHQARQKSVELQDLAQRNEDECREIELRIESLRKETQRLDDKHREATEKMQQELAAIEEDKHAAREALDMAYRGGMCGEAESEVQALRQELQEQTARFAEEERDFNSAVQSALDMIADFMVEAEAVTKRVVEDATRLSRESERQCSEHLLLVRKAL